MQLVDEKESLVGEDVTIQRNLHEWTREAKNREEQKVFTIDQFAGQV